MQPGQKKIYHNVCIQSFGLFFTLKEIGGRCKKEWVRNKGSDHKRSTLKKTFKRFFVEHAYAQEGRGKRRDLHDVHSRRKLFKRRRRRNATNSTDTKHYKNPRNGESL
jgi:hypothetical protein